MQHILESEAVRLLKKPLVLVKQVKGGYVLELTAAEQSYIVHTARGAPRVFRTLEAAAECCRRLGVKLVSLKLTA